MSNQTANLTPHRLAWQDVVRNRLKDLGAPLSSGHIHELRRSRMFLREHALDAIMASSYFMPIISKIEVAER
jgi:hypothetical protein